MELPPRAAGELSQANVRLLWAVNINDNRDISGLLTSSTDELRQYLRLLQEKKHRLPATESLVAFTEFTFPRYRTAPFHRQIAAQLERVERGEVDRLMLFIPPRHGKSELASRRFPAWYLGRHPDRHFISASAEAGLASDLGREVRNLIDGPEYRALFNTCLAEDSQAKGKWHTQEGGVYYAVGMPNSTENHALAGDGSSRFLGLRSFGPTAESAWSSIRRNPT